MKVAITGVGLVTALGRDPVAVLAALDSGRTGVRRTGDPRDQMPLPGYALAEVDVGSPLRRRRDRKLLPRAAELAIAAAAAALGSERPQDVALFLGVGREPSDQGDTARAILAARDGDRFNTAFFGEHGMPLYPPLASLRTLPNLVLAHAAIQLDLTGEGATRTGSEAAGLAAVVEGWRAVEEGRAEVALAGGADSLVDGVLARDLARMGRLKTAPGEAAAMIRIEPLVRARARGATVLAVIEDGGTAAIPGEWSPWWEDRLGQCGASAAPVDLVLALARGGAGSLRVSEPHGGSAWLAWSAP